MMSSRRWQDQEGTPDERRADRRASRRTFVDWLLGTGLGSLVVAVVYPPIRYLVPPRSAESATSSVELPFAVEDVEPNSGRIFRFGSRPGILVRTSGGEFRACSAVCTHLGCIVQYRPDLHHI